ncbi:Gp19/Gp15/Gp42 family protein [Rhodococcus qingshengii]|uniref:Gp19/Gp15/Gp42 family protein n=1 Tax=Rhodococcus qingshengii TaxID=334542 RepID=UPI001957F6DD|nr:Gp19/Gp15/Gp42 family protein [Rhodococcus qingshengii]QXC45212.1 phage Gp19/Gp15/Gp42 family protein [Rhodococcus qingshengii]
MTYAAAADVTTLWAKEPEPEVISLIERRLEQVERMLKRRIPDLAVRIAAGDIGEADVVDIEADAVLRVVRNPDGYLSETDGGYTYQLQSDLSSGKLTITDEEWAILGIKPAPRMTVIVPNLVAPVRGSSFAPGG